LLLLLGLFFIVLFPMRLSELSGHSIWPWATINYGNRAGVNRQFEHSTSWVVLSFRLNSLCSPLRPLSSCKFKNLVGFTLVVLVKSSVLFFL
jgi:hypothetical protein